MRIESRSVESFLNRPPAARIVLFFGADESLVRARADRITYAVVGARDDPFRVAWLSKEDHGRLLDEATAISMVGGRRVVRVREAADALVPSLRRVLDSPGDSLIVLEAESLTKRSKLRTVLEDLAEAAVVPCYALEGPALQSLAAQNFAQAGVKLGEGALAEFIARAGVDGATVRGEVDKLALYAGAGATIELRDVQAAVGDQALGSVDDAIFAAVAGRVPEMDRALETALEAGAAPVMLCRMLLGHLSRVMDAAEACARGTEPGQASRAVRPPLLFNRIAAFTAALPLWPVLRLRAALTAVVAAELACKQTGARDSLIVRRLFLSLSLQALRSRAAAR